MELIFDFEYKKYYWWRFEHSNGILRQSQHFPSEAEARKALQENRLVWRAIEIMAQV